MPNWCCSKFVFYGNQEDVHDFATRVQQYIDRPPIREHADRNWIGSVVEGFGLDYRSLSCSGTIDNCYETEAEGSLDASFTIETTTAWEPMVDTWETIISHAYDDRLQYVYLSEEPGMGIFINTDDSGDYLPEHWLVDMAADGHEIYEYFDDSDEMLDYMSVELGRYFHTLKELYKYADNINNSGTDGFCSIHEFINE